MDDWSEECWWLGLEMVFGQWQLDITEPNFCIMQISSMQDFNSFKKRWKNSQYDNNIRRVNCGLQNTIFLKNLDVSVYISAAFANIFSLSASS